MEIDLLKKKNCELEVHIEKIKQQTPKRINNQDKKKKKKWNSTLIETYHCGPKVRLVRLDHVKLKNVGFFSDKIKNVESTIEKYVKNLDNKIRLGNDLEQ